MYAAKPLMQTHTTNPSSAAAAATVSSSDAGDQHAAAAQFSAMAGRLWPALLRIAAGGDAVGWQLFGALMDQIVHWLGRCVICNTVDQDIDIHLECMCVAVQCQSWCTDLLTNKRCCATWLQALSCLLQSCVCCLHCSKSDADGAAATVLIESLLDAMCGSGSSSRGLVQLSSLLYGELLRYAVTKSDTSSATASTGEQSFLSRDSHMYCIC